MTDLTESVIKIRDFQQGNLGQKFADLEKQFRGKKQNHLQALNSANGLDVSLIHSALDVKRALGQINEIVHAVGILLLLPNILLDDEVIETISLGAGNTGKDFDLVTNKRIAEFKFISWKGGPESIRQNQLFKDYFYLAEASTNKKRCLYVMGLEYPMKFFSGNRKILSSVCSRNAKLEKDFRESFGSRFDRVYQYFNYRKGLVEIIDVNKLMPSLAKTIDEFV